MKLLAGSEINRIFDPVYLHFDEWQNYTILIVFGVLFGFLDLLVFKLFKRKFVRFIVIFFELIVIAAWLLKLDPIMYTMMISLAVSVIIFFFANINDCRDLIANSLKGKASVKRFFARVDRYKGESLFDREALYNKINNAVLTMSKSKTGALITFERNDSLNEIIKSGTEVNAPVSSELLQTIFYTGTRLHDGAVVIRKDYIVAASVYYTPTTTPLTGKYGSRHRAAIGISEITDAVTVVVSEETGRISIAYKGEISPVSPDLFLERLTEVMNQSEPKIED
ncbi:MAG: DNA integrity scanning protein DisA nucleotide-binding domain protein [Bacilli bacterium]|nr:DNA integrity scanning protein DisA nucleotide-binding domain protein [Bacilli bacterium]